MSYYMRYQIFAGGESCIEWENDLESILSRWHELCVREPHMSPIIPETHIREKIGNRPNGQLLIGVYDDSRRESPSHIRRNPRGYMLVWKQVEVQANVE